MSVVTLLNLIQAIRAYQVVQVDSNNLDVIIRVQGDDITTPRYELLRHGIYPQAPIPDKYLAIYAQWLLNEDAPDFDTLKYLLNQGLDLHQELTSDFASDLPVSSVYFELLLDYMQDNLPVDFSLILQPGLTLEVLIKYIGWVLVLSSDNDIKWQMLAWLLTTHQNLVQNDFINHVLFDPILASSDYDLLTTILSQFRDENLPYFPVFTAENIEAWLQYSQNNTLPEDISAWLQFNLINTLFDLAERTPAIKFELVTLLHQIRILNNNDKYRLILNLLQSLELSPPSTEQLAELKTDFQDVLRTTFIPQRDILALIDQYEYANDLLGDQINEVLLAIEVAQANRPIDFGG